MSESPEEALTGCLEAIHRRYGCDLRGYARPTLLRRFEAIFVRSGLASRAELCARVVEDPAFFRQTLEAMLVRVTELFRDPTFHRAFREKVVPVLRTFPVLKIWHAGCATGEEVYSTAIVLAEEGLYDRAEIYATDLSEGALSRARQALYPASVFPPFAARYAAAGGMHDARRYCTFAYDGIAMSAELRRNVVFFRHDLVSDPAFGEMNVIFCRNVLMYFGDALREQVLARLRSSLRPGGFLCLGRDERVLALPAIDAQERIYRQDR